MSNNERETYLKRISEYAALVQRLQFALGSNAEGDALVKHALDLKLLAKAMHRDHLILQGLVQALENEADYAVDTGPNDAMRFLNAARGSTP